VGRKKESDRRFAELIAEAPSGLWYQVAEVYAFRAEADKESRFWGI